MFCLECYKTLKRGHLPKYALNNSLYVGSMPEEFNDLTWVEEVVCSLYRPLVNITRLFCSEDKNARVFHGNMCAFEMNVASTASVLPWAPSDITDSLSIAFIGNSNYKKACVKRLYSIRKSKVWGFLNWLKRYNHLYSHIELDEAVMDMYDIGYIVVIVEKGMMEVMILMELKFF
ncbi:hypothetical protein SCHPADRAFT_912917 [Schizopora paradoxa]|uniref:DUF6570 domain-containing protein n=1 Tax=Schizopora paradoxa TaxID=27342 RepID=A0A0H2S3L4_9AGAM|nr:hypothetical protein SCHPADRAFT_912917 [Schizopora paradoxa]